MRMLRTLGLLGILLPAISGCSIGASAGSSSGLFGRPADSGYAARAGSRIPNASLVIGSFNLKRGGIESLAANDETGLRKAIKHQYPGSTFHYSSRLTSTFLSTVHVLAIGVANQSSTPITPLTKSEQSALLGFVKSGHTLVMFTDNDLEFQASSNSMLAPFGLHSTGVISGESTATFLGANPIQTGPAGTAQQLETFYPGWYDALGNSVDLANLSNGEPALAYFAAGSISHGSGPVALFSDSSLMLDGQRTTNDQIAVLNALAL